MGASKSGTLLRETQGSSPSRETWMPVPAQPMAGANIAEITRLAWTRAEDRSQKSEGRGQRAESGELRVKSWNDEGGEQRVKRRRSSVKRRKSQRIRILKPKS